MLAAIYNLRLSTASTFAVSSILSMCQITTANVVRPSRRNMAILVDWQSRETFEQELEIFSTSLELKNDATKNVFHKIFGSSCSLLAYAEFLKDVMADAR